MRLSTGWRELNSALNFPRRNVDKIAIYAIILPMKKRHIIWLSKAIVVIAVVATGGAFAHMAEAQTYTQNSTYPY